MSNIHVLKLAQYEPPTVTESKKNEWVTYGENNSYYTFLMDRYKNSTTNNAIINNISRLIYGKGLSATDANKKPNEYAQMMAMVGADDLRKVVLDFEMLGQAAFQVHYTKDRKKIKKVYHIPVHLLAPEKCNKEGEIEAYYYSNNWEDLKNYTPERIPAFGYSTENIEVLMVQPYSVGMKYFAYVDYQGGIPYAVLEEEISNYLINEVQRGFSGRVVVNFNNGQPTPEQQDEIKGKVLSQLSGTDGHKVIVSFNNNAESKTTVDAMPVNDAPDLYNQLSEEAMRKIMLSHNVTSPLLFGIASTNGFSSNADELRNSAILFENMVVKPKQEIILDAIDTILAFNGVALDLEFIGLNPLDSEGDLTTGESATKVIEGINALSPLVANKVLESMTPNEIRSLVGLPAEQGGSNLAPSATELSAEATDEELNILLNDLEGEVLGEEWERVTQREVSEDNISTEEWVNNALNPKKSVLAKLASVIKSAPSRDSNLDKSVYKVRYEYSERYSKPNSRDFCKKMMSRTNSGVVYRLEDIDKASRAGVNEELGHKGQPYDLFKFKGGVNCSHYWNEVLYKLKKKDGKYVEDKSLSSSDEVSSIPKSYAPRPTGSVQSKIAPIDMPNKGHHPNYGK
jgi:hypothetical protein